MPKLEYEDSFVKVASLLGSEDFVKVARALLNNPESTDEEIASATGLKINRVRKVLYELQSRSLIYAIRVRDPKRDWYVYRWKVQPEGAEVFLATVKRRLLNRLKIKLEYEKEHQFYHCGSATCPKRTFEEAVELVFTCPECGNHLEYYDNSELLKAIEWKISQLEEELRSFGGAKRIEVGENEEEGSEDVNEEAS
ncbi:transcription factor [Conexivisphaera calida]|uniref:Transcription factor E n=1 Tax=Conexivisphaera calida TaxID=1874277 RepID=A0A4V0P1E6_9ARCH|nr:transcription factor [Conexivisphaera calida]BBE41450.1 Archaeal transcription factor E [Conexivisphaera calida]